jgi:predicted dehydrogenase
MQIRAAAVVGTGFIGTVHVEAIRRTGIHVKGVLAGSTASTEQAKTRLRLEKAYGSISEICADPDITVVHVTSPNELHFSQVSEIMLAGKHVLCEKPLATSIADGKALVALANQRNLKHALAFNTRFYPLVREAKSRIASGVIGSPTYITGHYHQDWLMYSTDWNWRVDPLQGGAIRAVADIGSHLIDNIGYVSELEVSEVFADMHTFVKVRKKPMGSVQTFSNSSAAKEGEAANDSMGSIDVNEVIEVAMQTDDAAGILVRYTNGARATLSISQVTGGRKNSMQWEIAGSRASLGFNSMNPEELWIGHRGEPNQVLQKEFDLLSPEASALAFYPVGHIEGFGETFRGLCEAFYKDIEEGSGSRSYPNFSDGVTSLLITHAIHESAQTKQWISVTESRRK